MGLFTDNSSWQAKQSILQTTVTFYDDCVKICEEFNPKFGDKKKLAVASWQCTFSHFLFHQAIFDQEQQDYRPYPPYFPVLPIADNIEGPPS
jgi:hypothetical protein